MTRRTEGLGRWVAFAAVLLFVVALIGAGIQLNREQSVRFRSYRTGVWHLVQAQVELLRLRDALDRYMLHRTATARNDLQMRFDIFWSRIPVVLESEEAATIRELPGVVPTFRRILDDLPGWDHELRRLLAGEDGAYTGLIEDFDELVAPLQALTHTPVEADNLGGKTLEARLSELTIAFGALFVAGAFVILVLLRQLGIAERLRDDARFAAAQASEARRHLSDVLQSVDAGITFVDAEGRLQLVNGQMRRYYPALSDRLAPGTNWVALLHDSVARGIIRTSLDAEPWLADRLARATGGGATFEQELADGRVLLIGERRTADGGLVTVRTDVTALRRARVALEHRLAAIEASFDGIAMLDREVRYTYASAAFARLLGATGAERLEGRELERSLVPEDRARLARVMIPEARQYGAWRGEVTALRADGTTVPIEINLKPLPDDGSAGASRFGDTGGFICVARDLTERHRAEAAREALAEQFHFAQKLDALGRLASGIAHDFNNILAAIQGHAAVLVHDLRPGSNERRIAERIVQSGERGKELVDQVLAFARAESVERRPVDLRDVVEGMRQVLRASVPEAVPFEVSLPDAAVPVLANTTQISQVLLNLCINARDAIEDRAGRIVLTLAVVPAPGTPGRGASPEDYAGASALHVGGDTASGRTVLSVGALAAAPGYARLAVRDDGCGIERAVALRMFDPFFTTKPPGKGTGLGLSAVQGITVGHGGRIVVDTRVGAGTTFTLYLPLADPAALAEPAPAAGRGQVRNGIIVVDDDELVGGALATRLERAGYEVSFCHDGEEALELFEAAPAAVDAVVTDLVMPGVDGLSVARRMLARRPDLVVVLCTGNADRIDREALAAAGGAIEVLLKPVDMRVLRRRLRERLDRLPRVAAE